MKGVKAMYLDVDKSFLEPCDIGLETRSSQEFHGIKNKTYLDICMALGYLNIDQFTFNFLIHLFCIIKLTNIGSRCRQVVRERSAVPIFGPSNFRQVYAVHFGSLSVWCFFIFVYAASLKLY